MKPEDYPPQEPFGDLAKANHEVVTARSAGIEGEDVQYGTDPYQSVGVHRAENPNGDVFMFIHGGGWTSGYKEWTSFMAPVLNAAGVTFVTIGYRLAPRHLYPDGVNDCAGAVAWAFQNILEYGGDPGRLFIGGHSAGGHYSSWLAVRRDWRTGLDLPDAVIRGCLPVSGVYDFTGGGGMKVRPRFLGEEATGVEADASTIHNIQGTPPPFLMAWGSEDFPHLITQAGQMQAKLEAAGGEVQSMELPGCDHLGASYACGDEGGQWITAASDWMRRH
jgi:arylformamidase